MTRSRRPPRLPMLMVAVLGAWIAVAALRGTPADEAMPASANTVAIASTGSGMPAPQVDASAPITEPSPTF